MTFSGDSTPNWYVMPWLHVKYNYLKIQNNFEIIVFEIILKLF